jgi:hypothetical protein
MQYAVDRQVRLTPEQARRINLYRTAAANAERDIPTMSATLRELLDLGLDAAASTNEKQA